jgi:hypothetical protein
MIIGHKVITGVRPYTAQEVADNEPSFWHRPIPCQEHSWLNADHVVTYCMKADGVWFTSTIDVCASCAAKHQAEIQLPPPNVLTVDEFNRLDRWKLDIDWGGIQGLVIIIAIVAGVVTLGGLFTASNYHGESLEDARRRMDQEAQEVREERAWRGY